MKKSQFNGIDFSVVEKFKAPIEKFNSLEDFQLWAGDKYKELVKKDFGGRDVVVANQRHNMSREWNYMLSGDGGKFSPSEQLLIFNGLTKNLKPNDNTYMPSYNKIVLNKTLKELGETLSSDKKHNFNFGKLYSKNIKEYYSKDIPQDYTGWFVIPSRINDRANFSDNVKKLQTISGTHWCTKSTHAKPYLAEGDFHIYLDEGKPKIAVRFDEDVVVEFQGESNNNRLVPKYFDVLENYVKENDLCLVDKAKQEFQLSQRNRDLSKDIELKIGDAIKNKDYEKILNYMNITTKKDEQGKMVLSHYKLPDGFDYKSLGINEEELLKSVSKIEGNADFTRSKITNLGNIEYIGGNANFAGMSFEYLGNIKEIGGSADFSYSKINRLGSLLKVGKDLNLEYAEIGDLYPLRNVSGQIKTCGADVPSSQVKTLVSMSNH